MKFTKTKLLSIKISFIMIFCVTILSPSKTYSDNAVEEINSSVLCENLQVSENRGLEFINEQNEIKTTIKPISIVNSIIETPVAGINVELSGLTSEEIEECNNKTNRWGIELTENEIDLLAKIVYKESQGESDLGQQAVIEVVLNRMVHWHLHGSLNKVLSTKNAFSTWRNRKSAKPTEREYSNIQTVLNGKTDILDYEVVYFSTKPRNDDIAEHIGGHYFCRYELDDPKDKE